MLEFVTIALLASSSIAATEAPSQWQSDYGKALAATRADNRPLLVVLENPGDPNAAVESNQMATEGPQAELLSAYQLCRIDVTTDYGKKVAKAFGAEQFPFTAIIDETGSYVLHKQMGQLTDTEWQETLGSYKRGLRKLSVQHTSLFRGDSFTPGATNQVVSPSYCPSCQKRGY